LIYRGDDNSYYEKFADGTVKCIDEEIPFEIPQGWEWCRLGDLYQHNTGKALNAANTAGTAKKYLTTSNVYWDQFDFTAVKEMPFTDEEIGKCTIKKGDLLVCEGGDIGRAAIWRYDYDICIQNHIHRLRGYVELCTYYFYNIFWLYKRSGIIGGKGIGIQGLSAGALHNILVPLPPLCEQYRIVEALDKYANLLNLYDDCKTKLDEMEDAFLPSLKKSILQYAIQGKLVPQNPDDEPASELLKRIEEEKARLVKAGKIKRDKNASVIFKGEDNKYYEKLGSKVSDITDDIPFDIPESWQWFRLSTLANLYTGNSINESDKKKYYTDVEGLEYIATKDLSFEGRFCYKNGVAIPESHLSEFRIAPKGAVLMCIEGGSAGRKVGHLEQDVCFGNKLCCFAPYADISEYILYYLQSPIFYDIFTSSKSGIIGGVSVNNLKQLLVPLPPYSEIWRIVPAIRKVLKSIEG
jgi:type I restriction enzyme S subunit